MWDIRFINPLIRKLVSHYGENNMRLNKKLLFIAYALIALLFCDSSIGQQKPSPDILLTNEYTNQ